MRLPVFIFSLIALTSTAQVGIGTDAPSSALDVESSGAAIDINSTSGADPLINFQVGGTTAFSIGISSTDKFVIGTGITVNSSQQVGIGTPTPTEQLEVDGNALITGNTTITGNADVTGNVSIKNAANVTDFVTLSVPNNVTATYSLTLPIDAGSNGQILATDGSGVLTWTAVGAGDVLAANNLSDLSNSTTARTNLGLAIGTDVQAYDTDLDDLADGSLTATKIAGGLVDDTEYDYLNGVTSAIQTQLDAKLVSANNLSDVANAATARTNLGLVIGTDVQAYDADLADLADGSLTATKIAGGLVDDTEYDYLNGVTSAIQTQLDAKLVSANNLSDVANVATARTNLGLVIGTDVQAYDADLDDLATGVFNEAGANVDFRIEGVTDTEVFFVDASTDRVGVGTNTPGYTLDVAGDINYSGSLSNVSDKRFKKDIHKIDDALALINQFDGYTYTYRKEEFPKLKFDTTLQIGFIAQEIKKVLPELVSQNDSGYYSVDYVKVTPVLLMAVKEQQATIDALNAKIVQIETALVQSSNTESTNDYNALLERIQALEALLIEKKELTVAK